jgi:hypothetical protein
MSDLSTVSVLGRILEAGARAVAGRAPLSASLHLLNPARPNASGGMSMAVSASLTRALPAAALFAVLAALPANAQAPAQAAPPKPYAVVKVMPAKPYDDASFAAFRKDLGAIAARKDRAALAKVTAADFFWLGENGDRADKKKPAVDNLAAAIGLDDQDGSGWRALAVVTADPTLEDYPDRKGVLCGPATPAFDEAAADKVAQATGTDLSEYGYITVPSAEVRDAPKSSAAVIDKLGQILVRFLPQDPPAGGPPQELFFRIVTPAGKSGYVKADTVLPLAVDQMCYVKDGGSWKIAGYAGG